MRGINVLDSFGLPALSYEPEDEVMWWLSVSNPPQRREASKYWCYSSKLNEPSFLFLNSLIFFNMKR